MVELGCLWKKVSLSLSLCLCLSVSVCFSSQHVIPLCCVVCLCLNRRLGGCLKVHSGPLAGCLAGVTAGGVTAGVLAGVLFPGQHLSHLEAVNNI